jgi:hypothetical protein
MNKIFAIIALATLAPIAANAAAPVLNDQSAYQQTVNGFANVGHETRSTAPSAPAYGAGQAG